MKKTSIAMCAVLFGALVISNAFAEDATLVSANEEANTTTGVVAEATTGDVETGAVATGAAEATTGDVTTGAVATGAVEATTGDVETGAVATGAAEAEKSINDALHAILDEYFAKNASKFNTSKDKKDFFENVKANINKAAENARAAQKEAFEIIKGALETYEIK